MLTVADDTGTPVAHVTERDDEHLHWRLIAAAPEMLAMVKALRYRLHAFGVAADDQDAADALIAKVDG